MVVVSKSYKRCSGCGEFKRASTDPDKSEFYRRHKGSAQLRSRCKSCDLSQRHEWDRQHPDVARVRKAEWRRQSLRDPEKAAEMRDYQRQRWREKHGVPPTRYRRLRTLGDSAACPSVDAGPFVAWLATLPGGSIEKATRTGLPDGLVRKLLRGDQPTVYLDTVDAAMLNADVVVDGIPQTLDTIYPLEDAA